MLVPDCVEELEGVLVPLPVAVTELLSELLPVLEEEAPTLSEAVGEKDRVLLPVIVLLADADPVPVLD